MPRSKATSTANPRRSQVPRYRFVGGKGGVGKTTCAAAMGIAAADRGYGTLIISTDPAPSLGDALGQRLATTPRLIRGVPRLHAVEIDAARALDRWISSRRGTLEEIVLRGTWLDAQDVSRLLRLSLPGIDEIAALLQIAELADDRRYDRIVVDTAPTGHLLRMLALPAVLEGVADVFDHLQSRHRIIVEALRGGWTPDSADRLIQEIRRDAEGINRLLRDSARTRLSWVTLPEPMSVEETADGVQWLTAHGIAVDTVIVNRITTLPPEQCQWCLGRRTFEQHAIHALQRRTAGGTRIVAVPAVDHEPLGLAALRIVGDFIDRRLRSAATPRLRAGSRVIAALGDGEKFAQARRVITPETRLVMFGGKGGVGKTTCAAAVAVSVAAASSAKRVLLLSADPAHSIGDVLGQAFSDAPRRISSGPSNLMVRELDAGGVFASLRERFGAAVEEVLARVSGDGILERNLVTHDRNVMRDLIELAPPGVDELVAIIEVAESITRQRQPDYDLVVIDTAPTGHALRLVETPAIVHDWVKALMAILLKYQPVVRLGELGNILVRLSQGISRLRDMMGDPVRTRFVVVTRAASLPRAETIRMLRRLRAVGLSAPVVIVNAVGTGTCLRCRREAAAQEAEIGALQMDLVTKDRPAPDVLLAPAQVPPPHGHQQLRKWRATWRICPELGRKRSRGRRSASRS